MRSGAVMCKALRPIASGDFRRAHKDANVAERIALGCRCAARAIALQAALRASLIGLHLFELRASARSWVDFCECRDSLKSISSGVDERCNVFLSGPVGA